MFRQKVCHCGVYRGAFTLFREHRVEVEEGYISFDKFMSAASDFLLRCSMKCRISPSFPSLCEAVSDNDEIA
jgi:hypothetical protein